MKQEIWYQCRMSQGDRKTVGFIEERGARVGALVEIDELGGFWTIESVGHGIPKDILQNKQKMDRNSFKSVKPVR